MTSPFVRHPSLICALLAIGCHDSGDAKPGVSASVAVQPAEAVEGIDTTDDSEEVGTTTPDGDTGGPVDADEDAADVEADRVRLLPSPEEAVVARVALRVLFAEFVERVEIRTIARVSTIAILACRTIEVLAKKHHHHSAL